MNGAFVITNSATAPSLTSAWMLIVEDPRALYIDILNLLIMRNKLTCFSLATGVEPGIHPEAEVDKSATIEGDVYIGANSKIAAGCVIKQGTRIGGNVIIRENSVIGCDGIALYKAHDGRVLSFPHLAGVNIEDDVEIGASCVVCRGVMHSTQVGKGTVLGNLVNIGHGVKIGKKCGCRVGLPGWWELAKLVKGHLGTGVNVRDNLLIGNECSIGMGSVVVKNTADRSSLFGNPAKRMRTINAGPRR